jgi:hypothetical protein
VRAVSLSGSALFPPRHFAPIGSQLLRINTGPRDTAHDSLVRILSAGRHARRSIVHYAVYVRFRVSAANIQISLPPAVLLKNRQQCGVRAAKMHLDAALAVFLQDIILHDLKTTQQK